MDIVDEIEEVLCAEVVVYKTGETMQSGVAEVDALDDDVIYVYLDSGEVQPFPKSEVKPCAEC